MSEKCSYAGPAPRVLSNQSEGDLSILSKMLPSDPSVQVNPESLWHRAHQTRCERAKKPGTPSSEGKMLMNWEHRTHGDGREGGKHTAVASESVVGIGQEILQALASMMEVPATLFLEFKGRLDKAEHLLSLRGTRTLSELSGQRCRI